MESAADSSHHLPDIDGEELTVLLASEGRVVVVDLWSDACAPCKAMAPMLAELGGSLADRACFVAVNLDDNPLVVGRFEVTTLPTILLFKDGHERERLLGPQTRRALVSAVEAFRSA